MPPASARLTGLAGRVATALATMLAATRLTAQAAEPPPAMFRGGAAHLGRWDDVREAPHYAGVRWRVRTEGPVRASPVIAGDVVYVGSGDGRMRALQLADGALVWAFDAGAGVNGSAAVTRRLVLFTDDAGTVHALERATGRARWRRATGPAAALHWAGVSGDFWTSSPTVVGERVVVGGADGAVYALDLATGAVGWRHATGGRVRSSPAVRDGVVYAASFDGVVYALDLATGAPRWTFRTDGASIESAAFGYDRRSIQASPAVDGGVVYVGARDGIFYAIDAATGRERWRIAHDATSWSIGSPAVGDSVVLGGSSDARFFHAVDRATGRERWRVTMPGTVWSSAALVGMTAFVGSGAGTVHAFDVRDGRERWRFRTGGPVFSSPAPADGALLVGSADGSVYAIATGAAPLARAVYWDTTALALNGVRDHARIRDALRDCGYEVLDARGLARWLEARQAAPAGGGASVVVFAVDQLPPALASSGTASTASPLRRYLDAGGKVVWLGMPPAIWPPDSAGNRVYATIDRAAPERLLGVSFAGAQFDRWGTRLTPAGRRWGLDGWWLSTWSIAPAAGVEPLALDERGRAAAWVRRYGGPPGTGFVHLGRVAWSDEGLEDLVMAAEYQP